MQFRNTVDRLGHKLIGERRVDIVKFIYAAVGRRVEPPCAAQVHHLQAFMHRLRHPFAREFMRCGQKNHVYTFFMQRFPAKCFQRISAVPADVWINFIKLSGFAALAFACKQDGFLHLRMTQKKPRQFESGIAGGPHNRWLNRSLHQTCMASSRVCSFLAFLLLAVMMSKVSSPATVPTTSSQASASMATATGCALPGMVLITSRFCALRTSRTNSRTRRETAGSGSAGASPLGSM